MHNIDSNRMIVRLWCDVLHCGISSAYLVVLSIPETFAFLMWQYSLQDLEKLKSCNDKCPGYIENDVHLSVYNVFH